MSSASQNTLQRRHATATSRQQAATALREAHRRLASGADAADACGWAIAMLPESPSMQRLMLDWLLRSGQFEEASTRSSAFLRLHAHDWRLWMRRAQALLGLGRPDEAQAAIERVLNQRPHHRGALLLAAEIFSRVGDQPRALAALEHAEARHPRDPRVARRLIEALLAGDRADDALAILEQMPDAEPILQSRVLAAQGRPLDARLVLDDAIHWELDEAQRDRLRVELIDVLERAHDWPSLRTMAAVDDAGPSVAARLAEACLSMGALISAGELLQRASAALVLDVHVAAAVRAANGCGDEAVGLLASPRLRDRGVEIPPSRRVEPWLRALLGVVVAEQVEPRSVRRAGADPAINVLRTLLPVAVSAFDSALHDQPEAAASDHWLAMRDACGDALQNLHRADGAPATREPAQPALRRAA